MRVERRQVWEADVGEKIVLFISWYFSVLSHQRWVTGTVTVVRSLGCSIGRVNTMESPIHLVGWLKIRLVTHCTALLSSGSNK